MSNISKLRSFAAPTAKGGLALGAVALPEDAAHLFRELAGILDGGNWERWVIFGLLFAWIVSDVHRLRRARKDRDTEKAMAPVSDQKDGQFSGDVRVKLAELKNERLQKRLKFLGDNMSWLYLIAGFFMLWILKPLVIGD